MLECGAGTRQSSNVSCQDCAPGSYKAWVGGGECNLCPRGKYSTQARATAESACVMCPENSYSEALGSRHASDCKCNVGYTQSPDGKRCEACPAGTYKSVNGSMECVSCSYGTYSTAEGATSVSTCVACPLLYFSQRGSSSPSNCSAPEVFTAVSVARFASDSQTINTCRVSHSDVLGVCKTDQDCGGEDRGKCDNGTCVCGERFGGVTCSACRPGFEGANCSVACDCHGHGICTSSGTCECGRWWRGSDCTDRLCPRGRGGALCMLLCRCLLYLYLALLPLYLH